LPVLTTRDRQPQGIDQAFSGPGSGCRSRRKTERRRTPAPRNLQPLTAVIITSIAVSSIVGGHPCAARSLRTARIIGRRGGRTDMDRTYDRYKYLPEMKDAVDRYDAFLVKLFA
jgi:hypothetical protein